jgi:hypothetical protein
MIFGLLLKIEYGIGSRHNIVMVALKGLRKWLNWQAWSRKISRSTTFRQEIIAVLKGNCNQANLKL